MKQHTSAGLDPPGKANDLRYAGDIDEGDVPKVEVSVALMIIQASQAGAKLFDGGEIDYSRDTQSIRLRLDPQRIPPR